MKLNPRTGVIELGNPTRKKLADSPPRKKKKPVDVDTDLLAAAEHIGRTIGRTIVEALAKMQKSEVVKVPSCLTEGDLDNQPDTTLTVTPIESPAPIYIDETIIDVGIIETGQLQTGKNSAVIAKTSTSTDKELSASKQKLVAIKGGRNR